MLNVMLDRFVPSAYNDFPFAGSFHCYATYITFQPQTTNCRYLQTGDRRNARFLVGDDSEEEEEDEKKDFFSDPESEESEDKSK